MLLLPLLLTDPEEDRQNRTIHELRGRLRVPRQPKVLDRWQWVKQNHSAPVLSLISSLARQNGLQLETTHGIAPGQEVRRRQLLPLLPWLAAQLEELLPGLNSSELNAAEWNLAQADRTGMDTFVAHLRTNDQRIYSELAAADLDERQLIGRLAVRLVSVLDWLTEERPELRQVESLGQLLQLSDAWHGNLQRLAPPGSRRVPSGEVVIADKTPDGHLTKGHWTVQRLTTRKQLEGEGRALQHCVAISTYRAGVAGGLMAIYSVRDPDGEPQWTVQVDLDKGAPHHIAQVKSTNDLTPMEFVSREPGSLDDQSLLMVKRLQEHLEEEHDTELSLGSDASILALVGEGGKISEAITPPDMGGVDEEGMVHPPSKPDLVINDETGWLLYNSFLSENYDPEIAEGWAKQVEAGFSQALHHEIARDQLELVDWPNDLLDLESLLELDIDRSREDDEVLPRLLYMERSITLPDGQQLRVKGIAALIFRNAGTMDGTWCLLTRQEACYRSQERHFCTPGWSEFDEDTNPELLVDEEEYKQPLKRDEQGRVIEWSEPHTYYTYDQHQLPFFFPDVHPEGRRTLSWPMSGYREIDQQLQPIADELKDWLEEDWLYELKWSENWQKVLVTRSFLGTIELSQEVEEEKFPAPPARPVGSWVPEGASLPGEPQGHLFRWKPPGQ